MFPNSGPTQSFAGRVRPKIDLPAWLTSTEPGDVLLAYSTCPPAQCKGQPARQASSPTVDGFTENPAIRDGPARPPAWKCGCQNSSENTALVRQRPCQPTPFESMTLTSEPIFLRLRPSGYAASAIPAVNATPITNDRAARPTCCPVTLPFSLIAACAAAVAEVSEVYRTCL